MLGWFADMPTRRVPTNLCCVALFARREGMAPVTAAQTAELREIGLDSGGHFVTLPARIVFGFGMGPT
jgi:hypothetical protein